MSARWTRLSARTAVIALIGLLASALAACGGGSGSSKSSDAFRFGYPTPNQTMDPHKGGQYDLIYFRPVYDPLIGTDDEGNFVPALATDWSFSDDAMTLTLTLRDKVTFQDGEALTAESVKKSLEHAMAPESLVAADLGVVASVDAPDEHTVVLNMNQPGGHILGALATEAGMVISPKAIDDPDLANNPVGAGPYKLVSRTADRNVYEKYDDYWDADSVKNESVEIHLFRDDNARLRALKSGSIDAAYLRPSQIKEIDAAGLDMISGKRTVVYTMLLNPSAPGLGDPTVRMAISQAINRDSIDKNLQSGECPVTVQPFVDGYYPHVDDSAVTDPLEYDVDAASEALAAAGYGPDNPLQLTLTTVSLSQYQTLATALQDQFKEAGIDVSLNVAESTQVNAAKAAGDYQLLLGLSDVGRPDPTTYVEENLLGDGSTVPDGQQLLSDVRSSTTPKDQAAPMQKLMSEILASGPPVVSICAPKNVIGADPAVSGLVIPPLASYDFRGVTVG